MGVGEGGDGAVSELRDIIGKAMLRRFKQAYDDHGEDYNPDVVWDATDEVIAALVAERVVV